MSLDVQAARISDQLGHIRRMLSAARGARAGARWLAVVGHYPVFSAGSNGDTAELQTYLQPLLEEFRVDVYISGHDHMSEHLRCDCHIRVANLFDY